MIGKTELRMPLLPAVATDMALPDRTALACHAENTGTVPNGVVVGIAVVWFLSLGGGTAEAFHPIPNNPAAVGEIGPLIPFHKDAPCRSGLDRGQSGHAQSMFLDETR
jgi:hypothetical protein